MLTRTKVIVASALLLGSASVASAEDPELNFYHVQPPTITSQAGQYVLPNAALAQQQLNWRKRSNSH